MLQDGQQPGFIHVRFRIRRAQSGDKVKAYITLLIPDNHGRHFLDATLMINDEQKSFFLEYRGTCQEL